MLEPYAKQSMDDSSGLVLAEQFGLLQEGLGCLFLVVRRIPVLAKDALDPCAQLGADVANMALVVHSSYGVLFTVAISRRRISRLASARYSCARDRSLNN